MIEVRQRDDAELAVLREIEKEVRQGDRVGPPGDSDEHTRARRTQCVPADGAADLLLKGCQEMVPEGRLELPTPRL